MIEIIIYLITINYLIFISLLIFGFDKIKPFSKTNSKPKTSFSIVVPFRNEEKNLLHLLNSISELNYPKELFEIIVIDDDSKDNSAKIFNQWRFQNGLIETTLLDNLRLSKSPKKDAISRAVPIVKNEWIVTTDADCEVNPNWLLVMDSYIQNHQVSMLVGAVKYKTKPWNFLHFFQQMDLMSLQGTTIGSFGLQEPFMCNGANFAYKKSFFNELKGFVGNDNLASGDDVFLLQKAVDKHQNLVHYIKNTETIVTTKPEKSLLKLFMQRVRWASKTASYKSDFSKGLAVIVLLMNFCFVAIVIFEISGFRFHVSDFKPQTSNLKLTSVYLIKFIVDYILLNKTNRFLRNGTFLMPILSSFLYPFFSSLVGIYSLFGSFSWKRRKF